MKGLFLDKVKSIFDYLLMKEKGNKLRISTDITAKDKMWLYSAHLHNLIARHETQSPAQFQ